LLDANDQVVLVHGLGGVGKTELCKRYFHDQLAGDRYRYFCWINYQSSLQESLVNQYQGGDIVWGEKESPAERFKKLCVHLANLGPQTLVVIDNLDNDLDPGLSELAGFPGKVLASSRMPISGHAVYHLGFLEIPQCRELFRRYYLIYRAERDNTALEDIIALAGQHTLTVELLAKTAQNRQISLSELRQLLQQSGFDLGQAIQEEVELLKDGRRESGPFFEHLRKLFPLAGLTSPEEYILANLAILPSLPLPKTLIKKWLALDSFNDLNRLVAKGWLLEAGGDQLWLHQVLQEIIHHQLPPNPKNHRNLLQNLATALFYEPGDNPLDKAWIIIYAKAVLAMITSIDWDVATLANNLSLILQDLGRLDEALEFQQKAIIIFEKVLEPDNPALATSYNNLSSILHDLSRLNEALEFQQKAIMIREKVLEPNHPDLASSYSNLSLILQDLGRLDQALEFQQKALMIREKILEPDHPALATSYSNLSLILRDLERLDQALEFQQKAIMICEKVLEPDHPDLATSYSNLSLILQDLGRLDQALEFQRKAFIIREKVLESDHPALASSYNNLAHIYFQLEDYGQAKAFFEKALGILQKSLPMDHPKIKSAKESLLLVEQLQCRAGRTKKSGMGNNFINWVRGVFKG
jgi:tetratricopeptide (TPR) repeat protein